LLFLAIDLFDQIDHQRRDVGVGLEISLYCNQSSDAYQFNASKTPVSLVLSRMLQDFTFNPFHNPVRFDATGVSKLF
jgi:hypothetical protein